MSFPTPGAYQQAIQFPASAFTDPLLQDAEPEEALLGLPRAITGAFAVVFPMRSRDTRWAVKCFVTQVTDQRERYEAIAEHLNGVDLPYTVPFEYQADGIRVDDETYPILKMEWVEAETLNGFVARHLDRPDVLDELVLHWREMVDALDMARVAHGDLQHGNVLVGDDSQLKLVDYDTMFVPALRGRKSPEVGHRNYQHPDRDESHFGPYLDRFAALVLDTGLRGCAAEPDLWERFDTGENVLFRSDDLADPDGSALFERLGGLDEVSDQVDALRRACYLEPEDVPPLMVVVSDTSVVPSKSPKKAAEEKGVFERYVYPIAAAILLVVALVQVVESLVIAVGVVFSALAGGGVWAWLKYRKLPVIRRKRRLEKEDVYFEGLLEGLRDARRRLEDHRESMVSSHAARYEERLEAVQEEALNKRLKYHFVGEAREVDGITHKVVVRLKASGIRTAAHATPGRVGEIVLMSDESKARVNLWRATLVSQYREEVPESLSPAEERRLQRALDRELEAVDAELTRVRAKISVQEEEHRKITDRRAALDVPSFEQFVTSLIQPRSDAQPPSS